MTKATLPDGSLATYKYDAFGRRIEKRVTDKVGNTKTTEFVWQGDTLIAETSKDHYQSYIYEPGTFKPMVMLSGEGTDCEVYHYHLDQIGTPTDITDLHGKSVWSVQYRAYGNVLRKHVEEIASPLRFQGQYFDEETGLHYNRHRYYSPNTGRFVTADPIGLAGGLNNYQYVPNPTGWVDPLGLAVEAANGVCCGLYDSRQIRDHFEHTYGKENVVSTTVPPSNAKNVKLAGKAHPVTGVPYDFRGYPIFDAFSQYDTQLPNPSFNNTSYTGQMKMATRDLKNAINKDPILKSKFTEKQLDAIYAGKEKIPGYTWHHHQEWGRMQLVNSRIHSKTGHIGGESISKGQ